MTRHIVARTSDIPPGGNKVVDVEGRDIVVFHVKGEFFALLNRCPHAGAPLDKAACVARLTSPEPGVYQRSRVGELLRCAWHGWEFDMRNGQSWFDPKRVKVRTYPVAIEDGETLAKGPYVAETFPVHVEDSYVMIEVKRGFRIARLSVVVAGHGRREAPPMTAPRSNPACFTARWIASSASLLAMTTGNHPAVPRTLAPAANGKFSDFRGPVAKP